MKRIPILSVLVCSLIVFAPLGPFASQSRGDVPNKGTTEDMIDWGLEKNGVRCAVALPSQEKVFAGEPVQVRLLTKNVGVKRVSIVTEGHPLSVFSISVQGPDGKPTPFTSYGRQQMDNAGEGSRAVGTLAPGDEDTNGLLLSRIFDMTRQGEYKVSFTRWARGADDTGFSVTSNTLTITVAGARAEYIPN